MNKAFEGIPIDECPHCGATSGYVAWCRVVPALMPFAEPMFGAVVTGQVNIPSPVCATNRKSERKIVLCRACHEPVT